MNGPAPQSPFLRAGIVLYLVRHGETDWNRDARYQGQRDIPLNETGRAQARQNGAKLRALMPEIGAADFVASPLGRSVETMEILRAGIGLPRAGYRIDPQLLELNYGHWEGQLAAELATIDPEGISAKLADPFGWRPRGGESYADLMTRVAAWIGSLERDTVAVTHGGVIRVARGSIFGLSTADVPFLDVPQDKTIVITGRTMGWL